MGKKRTQKHSKPKTAKNNQNQMISNQSCGDNTLLKTKQSAFSISLQNSGVPNTILLLSSLMVGVVLTIILHSHQVLNPANVDWILIKGESDLNQHFLGWHAFRLDDWRFPFGKMTNLLYPDGTSIVYTDSIPIFAVFFKIFRSFLPHHFQYFGIWAAIAYGLQFFFAMKISRRYSENIIPAVLTALFFATSIIMISRMFIHTALSGHFLILAAIYLLLTRKHNNKQILFWTLVNVGAICIQAYFSMITLALWAGFLIDDYLKHRDIKYIGKHIAVNFLSLLSVAYLLGYFLFFASAGADSSIFSLGSMNLNAFFNPMFDSVFAKAWSNSPIVWFHEGRLYLGAGMILLTAFSVILTTGNKFDVFRSKRITGISFAAVATWFFALGTKVYFGSTLLFEYAYPGFIIPALSLFRTNGRMGWLMYYMIFLFSFYMFFRFFRGKTLAASLILLVLLGVQTVDFSTELTAKRKNTNDIENIVYASPLKSCFWDTVTEDVNHFITVPYNHNWGNNDLAYMALERGWTYSSFRPARLDIEGVNEYANKEMQKLLDGSAPKNHLYRIGHNIHHYKAFFNTGGHDHYYIDGNALTLAKGIVEDSVHYDKVTDVTDILLTEFLSSSKQRNSIYALAISDRFEDFNNDEEIYNAFTEAGLNIFDRNENGSYIAVWGASLGIAYQSKDTGMIEWSAFKGQEMNGEQFPFDLNILSSNGGHSRLSNILINGVEYSPNFSGITVAEYDVDLDKVSAIYVFDTWWEPNNGTVIFF